MRNKVIYSCIPFLLIGCSTIDENNKDDSFKYNYLNNSILNKEVSNINIKNPSFESFYVKDSNFYGINDFSFDNTQLDISKSNFFNNTYISTNNDLDFDNVSTVKDSLFNINLKPSSHQDNRFHISDSYIDNLRVYGELDSFNSFNIFNSSFNKLTLELVNNKLPFDINLNNNSLLSFNTLLKGKYNKININNFSSDSLSFNIEDVYDFNLYNFKPLNPSNSNINLSNSKNIKLSDIINSEFFFLSTNNTEKLDIHNLDSETNSLLINGNSFNKNIPTKINLSDISSDNKLNFESYGSLNSSLNASNLSITNIYFKNNFKNTSFDNIYSNKFVIELTGDIYNVEDSNLFISNSTIIEPLIVIKSLKNANINLDIINKDSQKYFDSNLYTSYKYTNLSIKTSNTENLDLNIQRSDISVLYIEIDENLKKVNLDISRLDEKLNLFIDEDFFKKKKLNISKQLCFFNDGMFKIFEPKEKRELSLDTICKTKY